MAGEDYKDRPAGDPDSVVRMEPGQEMAECIVEILQDSKREDREELDLFLGSLSSSSTLVETTLHATDIITTIYISDDECMYCKKFFWLVVASPLSSSTDPLETAKFVRSYRPNRFFKKASVFKCMDDAA